MSFLKSLFGFGKAEPAGPPKPVKQVEHEGFVIKATPYPEGGQHQLCGVIEKDIDGSRRATASCGPTVSRARRRRPTSPLSRAGN